ncbi:hypothetical protein SELMODRAFT_413770 [Selaginella moellendorffii]|uniref:Uncharacterized protein n=1 Tax=Selaginella moellendorffii TaxID=88036 RepID=D8RQ62_SELML|nr:hypothetical protein SELMODRAFT_413770 [Selaginella moellendorffii]
MEPLYNNDTNMVRSGTRSTTVANNGHHILSLEQDQEVANYIKKRWLEEKETSMLQPKGKKVIKTYNKEQMNCLILGNKILASEDKGFEDKAFGDEVFGEKGFVFQFGADQNRTVFVLVFEDIILSLDK